MEKEVFIFIIKGLIIIGLIPFAVKVGVWAKLITLKKFAEKETKNGQEK